MRIKLDKDNPSEFIHTLKSITKNKKVVFACVGTDRSTGDSLGPLIGSSLELLGYNVVGTLDNPLHATNLSERMAIMKQMDYDLVIAIDACLGRINNIGSNFLKNGPIKPGKGVGKEDLPEIGDYNITGVVNVGGYMEYMVLQNTRLSVVTNMSKLIVEAINSSVPLDEYNFVKVRNEIKLSLLEKIKSIFTKTKIRLA